MKKEVPYENSYKTAKKFDKVLIILLFTSAAFSSFFIILKFFKFNFDNEAVFFIINCFIAFFSVVYFILEFFKEEIFQKAEIERKHDFIDNSLKTKLSLKNSIGYFTNDEINTGIYKLGVNCFENTFFTFNISKKMLPVAFVKFLFIFILFVFVALFSGNQILLLVMQIPLPLVLIKESYRIYRLNQKVYEVLEKFQSIYSINSTADLNELIINNVISYEKILSTYSILLNSAYFTSMNKELSKKWEDLKIKYNIK